MAETVATALAKGERTREEQMRADATLEQESKWNALFGLACRLTVDLPFPQFHVREFLKLAPGAVIATAWPTTRDIPLRVNGKLVAWGEFESSGNKLAVRLTELA